jgi:hypothetical protein
LSKKLHSLLDSYGPEIATPDAVHRFYPPQVTHEGEMIEFLAQMPIDTKIFLTMAVLGLAAMLIALRRLI